MSSGMEMPISSGLKSSRGRFIKRLKKYWADEWPDLIWNSQDLDTLIKKGLVYDLTDLIPKYCPNITKRFPDKSTTIWNGFSGP